ncbi:MAG: Sip1-related alpha-galactosidase, partial [Bacteroidota bacterium]
RTPWWILLLRLGAAALAILGLAQPIYAPNAAAPGSETGPVLVVVDDGWFDHKNRMLNALRPDPAKFPQGFGPLNRRLKEECGVKEIGVWHSFNGYWNGINADSELGEQYAEELFSWQTKPWATGADTLKSKTYHFIRPDSKALPEFYRDLHRTFQEQGFTFLKVDNQLVTEQMAPRNYPVFTLSEKMHEALYAAADEYFAGAVINCMDMTADAYLNFGTSAVARAVEDYFPVEDNGVGYKMPYGNAAVHLTMAVYNSLYFQQMVYPDFDMFESHNPDATFHAVARALNNGPIYVTDKPGEQDFTVLRKLCYSDGRLIRPERALTPTADCLFQIQGPQAFKAYSQTGNTGLLGVWNMADAEKVSGNIAADDVYGIEGEEFIVYEHFSRRHWKVNRTERLPVELSRMETQLYYVIPAAEDAAAIGLIDKYNATGTIAEQTISPSGMEVNLADHGTFAAILPGPPRRVLVDGTEREFTFTDGVLTVAIPPTRPRRSHAVAVRW